ncbi:Gfo/Idh/MocA family oxidoreductase [Flagellimonas onchidii]|uniref:Gfo/Idh/MocA family oxidoreductase n=1 Tax=Flagellimonas onchidii TaxID=2562684 RepID=UPI0010A67246
MIDLNWIVFWYTDVTSTTKNSCNNNLRNLYLYKPYQMIKIGIIGVGRMGKIHLENLSTKIEGVELIAAVNPSTEGQKFALDHGVKNVSGNIDIIIDNPEIDAVLISSSSDTHSDFAVKAGKAIFCEKPIDKPLQKASETVNIISDLNVPLMIGLILFYIHGTMGTFAHGIK